MVDQGVSFIELVGEGGVSSGRPPEGSLILLFLQGDPSLNGALEVPESGEGGTL